MPRVPFYNFFLHSETFPYLINRETMVTGLRPASEQTEITRGSQPIKDNEKPKTTNNRFFWFHITALICNVVLVALYASQVYGLHTECIVNDTNITQRFDIAFRLGFVAMFSEFLSLIGTLMLPSKESEK